MSPAKHEVHFNRSYFVRLISFLYPGCFFVAFVLFPVNFQFKPYLTHNWKKFAGNSEVKEQSDSFSLQSSLYLQYNLGNLHVKCKKYLKLIKEDT